MGDIRGRDIKEIRDIALTGLNDFSTAEIKTGDEINPCSYGGQIVFVGLEYLIIKDVLLGNKMIHYSNINHIEIIGGKPSDKNIS